VAIAMHCNLRYLGL